MNPSLTITEFSQQLQVQLNEKLAEYSTLQDELLKAGDILRFIAGTIQELKRFIHHYKFTSPDEEIRFFKETKPLFLSKYLYYEAVINLTMETSFKDPQSKQAYYSSILSELEGFMKKHQEFYTYCMTNASHLDNLYFTRSNDHHNDLDQDEKFTTGYDSILARMLSNDQLKQYILNLVHQSEDHLQTTLTWTASKAALIELIYALHAVEAFNNADIKLIATTFENVCNVSLGNYYRVFQDIRLRKKGQTIFLDELKAKLQSKIDEMD